MAILGAAGEKIDAEMRAQGFAGADPEAVYYAMLDAAPTVPLVYSFGLTAITSFGVRRQIKSTAVP